MKVVIAGGSGQIGTVLARAFHKRGDEVVILSRKLVTAPWPTVLWDGETLGNWTRTLSSYTDYCISFTSASYDYDSPDNKVAQPQI